MDCRHEQCKNVADSPALDGVFSPRSSKFASLIEVRYAVVITPRLSMDQYTTVREAVKLSGKSESTIKRLIHEIVNDEQHPDRSMILPTKDELERRRAAGEPYVWKIDQALLIRRFPKAESIEEGSQPSSSSKDVQQAGTVIEVLREQLQSKDRQLQTLETQLDRKDQQIENLNERMRESNVLMRELQQKLAIAGPTSTDAAETIVNSETVSTRKESPTPPKTASTTTTKKRSLWSRPLFSRSK